MSDTLQEREDQIELCDGDHVFRQVEGQSVSECVCGAIRDYDDAQSTTTAGYCEECKGQPHAPWCSEYKEADEHCPFTRTWVPDPCVLPKGHTGRHMNAIEQEIATSEHQPAARGGGDEWCKVDIPVSLEEAETIAYVLNDADEDHLANHIKYCIQEAKRRAGYLQPKGKVQP